MRRAVAALGLAIVTLLPASRAEAQNYPWCAYRGDGATNCGYVSYEQCLLTNRTGCYRNPMYQPPTAEGRRPR